MKTSHFFSIIIPTYNRCELVKKCIASIQRQTFTNWECIIVNDGSTDNTADVIPRIIENDTRFSLINQQNSERSISRNNGAKKAKGDYFIFIDSDDYFEPEHLNNLYQAIVDDQEHCKMYFTNGKAISNKVEEIIVKNKIPSPLPIDFFLKNAVIPARVCLHHTIFNLFAFDPRTIIVEDTVLWTEILEKHSIKYIPITSVIYHLHDDNSININKYNAYNLRLKGLKVLFYNKEVGKKIPSNVKRTHLNRCYYGISEYHFHQKNYTKAINWIVKSIIQFPELDLKHKFVRSLFLIKFALIKPKENEIHK
jgi:glycosyltransferase involved in cell wall biosynthesis